MSKFKETMNEQEEMLRRRIQNREIDKLRPINVGLNAVSGLAFGTAGAAGILATCLIGSNVEKEVRDRRVLCTVAIAAGVAGVAALRSNRHYAKKYARRMADASYVAGYRRGALEIIEDFDDLEDSLEDIDERLEHLEDLLCNEFDADDFIEEEADDGTKVSHIQVLDSSDT